MIKILLILFVFSFVGIFALFPSVTLAVDPTPTPTPTPAAVGPQVYTWTYSTTNLYTSYSLIYLFHDLDTAQQYTFSIFQTDNNGTSVKTITTRIIGPGSTEGSFVIEPFEWPEVATPLKVVDNFGQVLGKHYLALKPLASWTAGSGTTSEEFMVGIGDTPYVPLGITGYHHPVTNPAAILTRNGEFTLLHYRADCSTYPTPLGEYINLYAFPLHVLVGTFSIDELIEYNHQDLDIFTAAQECDNFIVLTTGGKRPNFISEVEDISAFSGSFDDPHNFTADFGIYDYIRFDDSDVKVSNGESVWIVSKTADDNEWTATVVKAAIKDGRYQTVRLRQATKAVREGYPNETLLVTLTTELDTNDHLYAPYRIFTFVVSGSGEDWTIWRSEPADMRKSVV